MATHYPATTRAIIITAYIGGAQRNTLHSNTITNNPYGISLGSAYYNTMYNNSVTNNGYGIWVEYAGTSNDNLIYHNNFIDNDFQVSTLYASIMVWDDGYPSGGNYWSNYTGVDLYSGPNQDQPGSDGIGDTPYIIDDENQDRYPLMKPWGALIYTLTVHAQKLLRGAPIKGVNVTVYSEPAQALVGSALTDENGNAIFRVPAGTYTIIAKRHLFGPIHISKEQTVEISGDTTVIFKFLF